MMEATEEGNIYIYIYTLKMENKKQLNKQPNNFHKLENKKRKIQQKINKTTKINKRNN